MPIYRTKNENFFKKWSPDMAYVLGFFTADGSMYRTRRGTHFVEFEITDRELLLEIQRVLGSNHKIAIRRRRSHQKLIYRLQIGSKRIFHDLLMLGLTQGKSATVRLPQVPDTYFSDFLRGYFDGDGNVMFGFFKRSNRYDLNRVLSVRFTSGSRLILEAIKSRLSKQLDSRGSLFWSSGAWRLDYSTHSSKKIFRFMYSNVNTKNLIYLQRKYKIFQEALI